VISPGDCESFARTLAGVTRARAYWGWDKARQCPDIQLYVGGSGTGDIAGQVRQDLPASPAMHVPLRVRRAGTIALRIKGELVAPPGADSGAIEAAAARALTDRHTGLFSARRPAIGQRLYRSQVEAALASSGAIAIRHLKIERAEPPQGGSAAAGGKESVLDPGQGAYFTLHASDLRVRVVPP